MLTLEIKSKVQSLWDRLWAGGLSNPITAIEQISFLLFMKRLENFQPLIPRKYKWSTYHTYKDDRLAIHVKEVVFPYIKFNLSKKGEPFANSMEDASFRINNPSLLSDAMTIIDSIYGEIEKQEKGNRQYFQDIQGDLYEHLLKQTSEAGKNGQFRTPRHIIQVMTELLEPKLDGKICDLACGSGGFLVGAYQYIVTQYSKNVSIDENGLSKGIDGKKLSSIQQNKLNESTFFGFDIDQTMVRIGIMNLMMHGIKKPKISHLDTLSSDYEKFEGKKPAENYKYILANPPFTGRINNASLSKNLNRIYSDKKQQSVQSEILFLERIIFMLAKDGKAAVIVPEGLLFNSGKAYQEIRRLLMTDCDLEGVISLPEGLFMPYTGVKTSILIFKKRKLRNAPNQIQKIQVWFYNLVSDGYSLDTSRRKLKEKPLPILVKAWHQRTSVSQKNRERQHFSIPFDQIAKNGFELNFNLYQDFTFVPQNYRPTEDILLQLSELESEILKGIEEIKSNEL